MKQLIKNIIEDFRRLKMRDGVFSFYYNTKKIYFYLPSRRDYIQQQILFRNTFYEDKILQKVGKFVEDDFTFLDIGSNIGNHIIYFAKIFNAKKIYGFEPQKKVFEILKKNVGINSVSDKVELFDIGLGSCEMNAREENTNINNSGAAFLKSDKEGEIKIKSLDSLNIKDKIDFIKIDTEGFEGEVLIGGKNLIEKNLPIIWAEVHTENIDAVFKYLKELNYKDPIKLDDCGNYLFIKDSENVQNTSQGGEDE